MDSAGPERTPKMSTVSIFMAEFDHNTPLVLEFNEITSLMAISSVGIIAVMLLSVAVAARAFFNKKGQDLSKEHFNRR
jgi:hypothetical protein